MAQPLNWRFVTSGSKVWVQVRKKWLPGIINNFGSNKEGDTNVEVITEGIPFYKLKRKVKDLYSRKAEDDYPHEKKV